MKNLLVSIVLAASAIAAHAQPAWITVGSSPDGDTWQLDAHNTTRTGNRVTYWARELLVKPLHGATSNLVEIRIDCTSASAVTQTSVWFNANGDVLSRSEQPTPLDMPPGSAFRQIADDLCRPRKPG